MLEIYPSTRDPKNYMSAIRIYNEVLHQYASNELNKKLTFDDSFVNEDLCIVTTGSDGRLEKSALSPIELVILKSPTYTSEEELDTKVRQSLLGIRSDIYDSAVEEKDLSQDFLIKYSPNGKVFPTRALDSKFLYGNYHLYSRYRSSPLRELKGSDGKKFFDKFKDRVRSHRSNLRDNMKGTDQNPQFNLETGELFYLGNGRDINSTKRATKFGHLRTMQYRLARDLCKYFREVESPDMGKLLHGFPSSTLDRLNYLYYAGVLDLSSNELDDISNAYTLSLYWYHLAEENFRFHGQETTTVDPGELREVSRIALKFGKRKDSIIK